MLGQILSQLADVDNWLDDAASDLYHDEPLAQDWARIAKIGEEMGEVVNAFILLTGQNPRKPKSGTMDDVTGELADVAYTAILAMLHFTKNKEHVGAILVDKARALSARMVQAKMAARREVPKELAMPYGDLTGYTGMSGSML